MWNLANPWMLLGLTGLAIPVLIHLLNRRRNVVVDWGAMQFLELGRRARRRIELSDALLMAGRMGILGLVALALARPFWTSRPRPDGVAGALASAQASPRDLVLVLDASESMGRRSGGTTAWAEALKGVGSILDRVPEGSTVAVLLAGDRVRPLVGSLTPDFADVRKKLDDLATPRGASNLSSALAEALRVLEAGENDQRDIVVLTDAQRQAWRPDGARAWQVLRELHAQQAQREGRVANLWTVSCAAPADGSEGPDGALQGLELEPRLVPPLRTLVVRTTLSNAGPGPLTRNAELLLDGTPIPGLAQVAGPVPAGGRTALEFRTRIAEPGTHVLAVRLDPGNDPLPANDRVETAVRIVPSIPVLLVDGDPGLEPLTGETDFLRAALAPRGQSSPPVAITTATPESLTAASLTGQSVVVLANVDRLEAEVAGALDARVKQGLGVLVAPGRRVDARWWNERFEQSGSGWLPARLETWQGNDDASPGQGAHPLPASFQGSLMLPFGAGDSPALGSATLYGYWRLTPTAGPPAASVLARLDSGDPWMVERPYGRGRVILLASPLDAAGGTMPVNPDFVPLAHELITTLAATGNSIATALAGETAVIEFEETNPGGETMARVTAPDQTVRSLPLERTGDLARLRFADTDLPGVYRIEIPGQPPALLEVKADLSESDPARR